MIREIYCKLTSDPNWLPNIETQDEAYNILQQIKVVGWTDCGATQSDNQTGKKVACFQDLTATLPQ